MSTLLDVIRTLPRDRADTLRQQVRLLGPEQQQTLLTALRLEHRERCWADGLHWLRFVRTRDEADPGHTIKPFPADDPAIRAIWRELDTKQRVICAKSRQMDMSWIACAFACWWARSHPNTYVCVQTQKAEDAYKLVSSPKSSGYLGRCQFIERHLPAWLQMPGTDEQQGALTYTNGSMIEALAGGADQIRGKVPSLIILDEFAYQQDAKGVYTAINPLVQKGTKLVIVSTPNGFSGNQFAMLFHGISTTMSLSNAGT